MYIFCLATFPCMVISFLHTNAFEELTQSESSWFGLNLIDCVNSLDQFEDLKNCCFWTVVLEKTLQSPLDCKEIKPVHPKGNLSWIFIGRANAEVETPILWPPDENWLTGKDSDAGRDWRQEEKGTTEDEMIGLHHRLDGHEFEQAQVCVMDREAWECCSPWGCK